MEVPAGEFILRKDIAITHSNIVLRGAGVSRRGCGWAARRGRRRGGVAVPVQG